jgi:hypothetical protein
MQEQPLIDMGNYPRIEASEMAACYVLPGGRVRFVMCDWFKVEGVFRRVVTGLLTRPLAGLQEDQTLSWQQISAPRAPVGLVTLQ